MLQAAMWYSSIQLLLIPYLLLVTWQWCYSTLILVAALRFLQNEWPASSRRKQGPYWLRLLEFDAQVSLCSMKAATRPAPSLSLLTVSYQKQAHNTMRTCWAGCSKWTQKTTQYCTSHLRHRCIATFVLLEHPLRQCSKSAETCWM